MTRLGPTDYRAPSRLARFLIALRVPEAEREFVKGDLEEGLAAVRMTQGKARALLWYWRQLLSLLLSRRIGPPTPASPARAKESPMFPVLHDLPAVLRSLRRAPLFSSLVVVTLLIGIGASTAIFNVVYSALLAPPPYPDPDRLVVVWERSRSGEKENVGFLTGHDIRNQTRSFSSLAMVSYWFPIAQFGEEARQLNGVRVSQEYFRTLGVRPAIGRDFVAEEDHWETRRVVLLSHSLWSTLFGADSTIVGRTSTINGVPYLVAGVMPEGFRDVLTPQTEIWAPLGYELDQRWACRSCRHLRAIARLRSGVTIAAARHELDAFQPTLQARHPNEYSSVGVVLPTLQSEVSGKFRSPLLGLLAAAGLLLVLAAINVGNLFLGRTGERHTDLVIRMALGADRRRLVGLVTVEALILSLVGGALGATAGWWGARALLRLEAIPPGLASGTGRLAPTIAAAVGLTLLSALIGGSLPAALALRDAALQDIRMGTRSVLGRLRHRLRHAVVIAEVALAVVLLAAAGLQIRTIRHALSVETGFRPGGLLTFGVSLSGPRYDADGTSRNFYRRLLQSSRAVPGVSSTAVVSQLPMGGNFDAYGVHREDRPSPNPATDPSAQRFAISPDYFAAMDIALIRGRGPTEADREGADPAVWLNQAGAARMYGSDDPIGKRLKLGAMDGPWRTVVGIVEDVRHLSLNEEVENQIYLPFDQNPFEESFMTLVARTVGTSTAIEPALVATARQLDPGAAVAARSMDQVIGGQLGARRLALSLVGGFAAIALVLALGGLFGVISASVAERTREIGVRSALGATPVRLLRMVARQGLGLIIAGVGLGLGGLLALRQVLARYVFGVSPSDPLNLFGVALLTGLVAMIAMLLPALRAARVDPLIALHE